MTENKSTSPPSVLSIEVSLAPPPGSHILSPFTSEVPRRAFNASDFYADPTQVDRAMDELRRLGFKVLIASRLSISVEGTPELFEKVFGTKLETLSMEKPEVPAIPSAMTYATPTQDSTWAPPDSLAGLVERAHIQPPYLYFESAIPPRVDYHHLRTPGDLSLLLNAAPVHREGGTGEGVKVAMIDSGFYIQHPFFQGMGYNMARMLGPGAVEIEHDEVGHGTAEAANVFAVAPNVTFIGIKANSLSAAFKEAVNQNPDIITVSLGWDLRRRWDGLPESTLPESLTVIELEIANAVASGITVIFAAGNGHIGFPGMHPDVISAGGTYICENMVMQASDYASAFESAIYPGRIVPDVTGLVGMQSTSGAYIMLPLEPGCRIDVGSSTAQFPDGTAEEDGWSVISGTSAAAPQIAGVCALLKERDPGLTPSDIKAILKRSARDVKMGQANAVSNPVKVGNEVKHVPIQAGTGPDGATGFGLVDAYAAWKQV